jgi:sugar fermentation stimulation protein A
MKFQNLVKGRLIKRYKRFLADIELETGEIITAHCTNTGSMKSVYIPGAEVLISPVDNSKRKTKFTWEMIRINGIWVGVNTNNANALAYEWILDNKISGLNNLKDLKKEKKYGDSRFDIYGHDGKKQVWIEIKNVSLKEGDFALFPDAVTSRGQKHLKTLIEIVEKGQRAAMIYVIQRTDIYKFAPAYKIDPIYAKRYYEAKNTGVEIYVCQARPDETGIEYLRELK